MSGEAPIGAGVRGGAGCGGAGEELITTEVLAGERGAVGVPGAWVGGGSGTGVDALIEEELPTPPSFLEVDVLDSEVIVHWSRAVVHRLVPRPSSPFVEHNVARRAHTVFGSRMR